MTGTGQPPEAGDGAGIPGTITGASVHEALAVLYVPADLANCTLAALLPDVAAHSDLLERAQALRTRLLDAIDLLRPAQRTMSSASASRAYECLRMRYISGFRIEDVARRLALSPRQVYRDLRWTEEQLARTLVSRGLPAPPPTSEDAAADVSEDIELLAHRPEPVHLLETVEACAAVVAPLAEREGIAIAVRRPEQPLIVEATPAVLRETVTRLLSALVQSRLRPAIEVRLSRVGQMALLSLPTAAPAALARYDLVQAALQPLAAQGLQWATETADDGERLLLKLPLARRFQVLVVEDNPSARALYERYLASSEWAMVAPPHPRVVVDAAVAQRVDAVLLDIMMSETDGWSLLRLLKADERTHDLPVIVCSVVRDAALGIALGACAYLTKPVSRQDLLTALRQAVRRDSSGRGTPASP